MNYEKIIIELICHFITNEGTDYLGLKDKPDMVGDLTTAENAELMRLRDLARKEAGWQGY